MGSGNSAFETADHLKDVAASMTIITRRRELPIAYQTHYAGNVRAINLQFLDLYQLKSLASIWNGIDVNKPGIYFLKSLFFQFCTLNWRDGKVNGGAYEIPTFLLLLKPHLISQCHIVFL